MSGQSGPQTPSPVRFQKISILGRGSYGTVFLALNQHGKLMVLKEIHLPPEYLTNATAVDAKDSPITAAIREARLLQSLRHPNVIKVYGAFESAHKGVTIVMEYADGGDLAQRITHRTTYLNNKKAQWAAERNNYPIPLDKLCEYYFSERRVVHWGMGICLSLSYLHAKHILHRDIKTANILLTKDHEVKLGDFGVARQLETTFDGAKTQCGTPFYLSPEVAKNESYDTKSDVWAMGVVLYELCSLQRPFSADNILSLVRKIVMDPHVPLKELLPGVYSDDLSDLLDKMLSKTYSQRPDIHECMSILRRIEGRAQWHSNEEVDKDSVWEADREAEEKQQNLLIEQHLALQGITSTTNNNTNESVNDNNNNMMSVPSPQTNTNTTPAPNTTTTNTNDTNKPNQSIKPEPSAPEITDNADFAERSLSFDGDEDSTSNPDLGLNISIEVDNGVTNNTQNNSNSNNVKTTSNATTAVNSEHLGSPKVKRSPVLSPLSPPTNTYHNTNNNSNNNTNNSHTTHTTDAELDFISPLPESVFYSPPKPLTPMQLSSDTPLSNPHSSFTFEPPSPLTSQQSPAPAAMVPAGFIVPIPPSSSRPQNIPRRPNSGKFREEDGDKPPPVLHTPTVVGSHNSNNNSNNNSNSHNTGNSIGYSNNNNNNNNSCNVDTISDSSSYSHNNNNGYTSNNNNNNNNTSNFNNRATSAGSASSPMNPREEARLRKLQAADQRSQELAGAIRANTAATKQQHLTNRHRNVDGSGSGALLYHQQNQNQNQTLNQEQRQQIQGHDSHIRNNGGLFPPQSNYNDGHYSGKSYNDTNVIDSAHTMNIYHNSNTNFNGTGGSGGSSNSTSVGGNGGSGGLTHRNRGYSHGDNTMAMHGASILQQHTYSNPQGYTTPRRGHSRNNSESYVNTPSHNSQMYNTGYDSGAYVSPFDSTLNTLPSPSLNASIVQTANTMGIGIRRGMASPRLSNAEPPIQYLPITPYPGPNSSNNNTPRTRISRSAGYGERRPSITNLNPPQTPGSAYMSQDFANAKYPMGHNVPLFNAGSRPSSGQRRIQ